MDVYIINKEKNKVEVKYILKKIINNKFNVNIENVNINYNKYGKPYLSSFKSIKFNISHSGKYIVYAFDDDEVGIDIEQIKKINYQNICKRFFHKKENNYIKSFKKNKQLYNFYKIWTIKESYVKCIGKGLSIPLNSFYSKVKNEDEIEIVHNDFTTKYGVRIINLDNEYIIAVCGKKTKLNFNFFIN